MEIANPIYDSVFKYLMEDKRVAKLIISSLTDLDVIDIELRPTEYHHPHSEIKNLTVYRLDFAAQIRTPEGPKLVLIEIQKAKFSTDIMRFRRYLGEQYASPENFSFVEKNGKSQKIGEPILTIYFLGHYLDFNDSPVIKVKRSCIDAATNKALQGKDDFIESLTHDSVIVQIPALAKRRRNRLEILLSIFDQELILIGDKHKIELNEDDVPKEFHLVIRRLLQASALPELRKTMTIEDEIVDELERRERMIAELGERAEHAIIAQKQAEAATQQAEAATQQAEAATQQAEAATQQAEADKRILLDNALQALIAAGISPKEAKKQLGI